jgi:hypothetical protein
VTGGRDAEPYPDRAAWPGYWRTIRTATVWLLVAAVIVGGGSFLPRPDELLPRIVVAVVIGFLVVVVAAFLAGRVNAWWQERHT